MVHSQSDTEVNLVHDEMIEGAALWTFPFNHVGMKGSGGAVVAPALMAFEYMRRSVLYQRI
jgi:hypothetical protein